MAEKEANSTVSSLLMLLSISLLSRYNELMFVIDTCQASSMFSTFYSPNIVATGSSSVDEDSLSVSAASSELYLASQAAGQVPIQY